MTACIWHKITEIKIDLVNQNYLILGEDDVVLQGEEFSDIIVHSDSKVVLFAVQEEIKNHTKNEDGVLYWMEF